MELVDGLKEEEQEEDVQPGGQEEGDAEAAAETDAAAEGEGEGDADDAAASEEQLAEEAQLRRDKEQANKKKVRHTLRTLDGITSQTTTKPEDAGAHRCCRAGSALSSAQVSCGVRAITRRMPLRIVMLTCASVFVAAAALLSFLLALSVCRR